MTIKALLPSPRYTGHWRATECAAFPGRLLSRFGDIQWPSNSPDLTAADFFLWGYLKAQVFTHTLPDINSPKNAICQEIVNVTQDTLHRISGVPRNFFRG
jgi:hypothetical protein